MADIAITESTPAASTVAAASETRLAVCFDAAAATDAGRSRGHNEDNWCLAPDLGLLALADGMGGYNAGEVASSLAIDSLVGYLRAEVAADGAADPLDLLARGIGAANASILAAAARRPECLGMGTTMAAAWMLGSRLYYAHVGDSRIYLVRGDRLARLTRDHSVGQAMIDAGMSEAASTRRGALRGVLTRALGVEPSVEPTFGELALEPGDTLLLCTDGLTDLVADAGIARLLLAHPGPSERAKALVAAALDAGGYDNVTVIVALPRDAVAACP